MFLLAEGYVQQPWLCHGIKLGVGCVKGVILSRTYPALANFILFYFFFLFYFNFFFRLGKGLELTPSCQGHKRIVVIVRNQRPDWLWRRALAAGSGCYEL